MTKRSTATSTSETTIRTVNLRVREDIRDLIDRAAQSQGKSRSEFMIDAARRAAEDALLDQTLIRVDAETHAHFLNVLDQPPSGEGYERLMKAVKPWQADAVSTRVVERRTPVGRVCIRRRKLGR